MGSRTSSLARLYSQLSPLVLTYAKPRYINLLLATCLGVSIMHVDSVRYPGEEQRISEYRRSILLSSPYADSELLDSLSIRCVTENQGRSASFGYIAAGLAGTAGLIPSAERMAESCANWASALTEPLCQAHCNLRRLSIPGSRDGTLTSWREQLHAAASMIGWGALSPSSALTGVFVRKLGLSLQAKDYLYRPGLLSAPPPRKTANVTVLYWNVCCVAGGYPVSDGGVLPWQDRITRVVEQIKNQGADVVCLQEVFDNDAAVQLIRGLKGEYGHFYYNVGAQAASVCSGLFVASKAAIDPHFERFPVSTGRAAYAAQGVLSFRYGDVDIIATHLVNSEEPEFPTEAERAARAAQMEVVAHKVRSSTAKTVIVGGDFNAGHEEMASSYFARECFEDARAAGPTWGGDGWCASMVGGKRISKPLCLDHAFLRKGSERQLTTTQVLTGFEGEEWRPEALSDHHGLLCSLSR